MDTNKYMDTRKQLFASTIGGCLSFLSIYPSEVIKSNYQFLKNNDKTYFSVINNIYKTNGIKGFYRGMLSPMCMQGPRMAFGMTLTEYFISQFPDRKYSGYFSGAIAGALTGMFIATPTENIKTYSIHNNVSAKNAIINLFNKNNIKGFTKGIYVIAMKESFTYSSRMGTNHYLKEIIKPKNTLEVSLVGGVASAIASIFSTPFDVVAVRLQSDYKSKYKNIIDCFIKIYKEEGIKMLYRGAIIRSLRTAIGMSVAFGAIDGIKKLI